MCEEPFHKSISCENIEAVISLPNEILQDKHASNLDEYFIKKRILHQNIIERMRSEVQDLDFSAEKEVNSIIKFSKEELDGFKNELDDCISTEITTLDQWYAICNRKRKIKLQLTATIEEFYEDVRSLEVYRVEAIKAVLPKYKDEALKLQFLNIKEIETLFDEEIADLNKNTLDNFKTYEDLKLQFQVDGQESINRLQEVIQEKARYMAEEQAKHLWDMVKERQNNRSLVDTVFDMTQYNSRVKESFLQTTNNLIKQLSEFAEVLQLPEESELDQEFFVGWARTLNRKLEMFGTLCKNIDGLLKTAITSLLEIFDEQIDTLNRNVNATFQDAPPDEIGKSIKLSVDIVKLQNEQSEEHKYLDDLWKEIIGPLNDKIERVKCFTLDAISIWTNHVSRINQVHTDLDDILETALNNSWKRDKDKNIKIKAQVKTAREAKDIDKLNTQCSEIEKGYKDLEDIWKENYESQLQLLNGVRDDAVKKVIDRKKCEIENFLYKYPKREWLSYSTNIPQLKFNECDLQNSLIDQLNLSNTYMAAVDNRIYGMYEMVERYAPMCERYISDESEGWLGVYAQNIFAKFEIRLNEIRVIKTDVLQELIQIREAELNVHSERLLSHAAGVKTLLGRMQKNYEEVKSKQRTVLDDFFNKLNTLTESKPLNTARDIKSVISELEQEWNSLAELLERCILNAKTESEHAFERLQNSNDLFLKTAKNFKSGGNYSPEELKILVKELKQLEKMFTGQKKIINDNYNNLVKDISRTVLDCILEEMRSKLGKIILHDNVLHTLDILRVRLRSEVNNMNDLCSIFGKTIDYLCSSGSLDMDLVNDVDRNANVVYEYMKFPAGVLSLECGNKSMSVISSKEKLGTYHKVEVLKTDLLFQYVNEEVSSETNNFLARTKGLIITKYSTLVKSIQDIFQIKSVATEKKKVPLPSKKKDVNEDSTTRKDKDEKDLEKDEMAQRIAQLKSTLQLYNKECELAWIHQARQFLEHIVSLRTCVNFLIKNELKNAHDTYIVSLKDVEAIFKQVVMEETSEKAAARNKIHQSLVVPLAHPSHKHKLEDLHRKAVNICEDHKTFCSKLLMNYKNDLQHKHDTYVEKSKIQKENLKIIQTIIFGGASSCALVENFEIIKELSPLPSEGCTDVQTEDQGEVQETMFPKEPIFPQSIWYDMDDEDDSFYNKYLSSNSKVHSRTPSLDQTMKISVNDIATENIKQSAEHIQKLYDEAKEIQYSIEESADKCLKSFQQAMNQATFMYKSLCN